MKVPNQKRRHKKHYPNKGRKVHLPRRNLTADEKQMVMQTCKRVGDTTGTAEIFCLGEIEYICDGDFTVCLLRFGQDFGSIRTLCMLVGATKRGPLDQDSLILAQMTALAKAIRLNHALAQR